MPAVQTLFRIMAVCLALFWVPISGHCRIEALTDGAFLSCAGNQAEQGHGGCGHEEAPASDHCGDDACATVEDGHYKSDPVPVCPTPPVPSVFVWATILRMTAEAVPGAGFSVDGNRPPPPELSVSWQFASRVALAPRAPSSVS